MPKEAKQQTIGLYLIGRLHELGVRHVFGVPGDFSLKFCKLLETDGRLAFIGTTREDTAGFAADGYARRHDAIGVVLVTYGVGALGTVNPIAGAHAESSPVLVISGAPGVGERRDNPMIHHCFGSVGAQMRIFENFTCRAAALEDRSQALRQIDEVLEAIWSKKKPGYLELPRDMIDKEVQHETDDDSFCRYESSDEETLEEVLSETIGLVKQSKTPVILAGVELHRYGVQKELVQLVESARLPVAATIMGKSVINERHPLYLGVYQGLVGSECARQKVEQADVLLSLGVMFTDINMGMYTAKLDPNHMVRANQGEVIVKHHNYSRVTLKDFILGLAGALSSSAPDPYEIEAFTGGFAAARPPGENDDLTMSGIIEILNAHLTADTAVICDTGDCLFAATELKVSDHTAFFASAFYATMGFAVPAALGVACAHPETRPLILVGDGAFQMTGTELATFKKMRFAPIVIVVNNSGYETERVIMDGAFNDIPGWDYGKICGLLGYGRDFKAEKAGEFKSALQQALADKNQMAVINAVVTESSRSMRRLAGEIGRRMK
ncbi:MAG: alpha-keto acid decarboxylase family protein [Nitrospinales bacterium]